MRLNINDPDPYVRMAAEECLADIEYQIFQIEQSLSEREKILLCLSELKQMAQALRSGKDVEYHYDPT